MNLLITGGAGFIGSNLILYWLKQFPNDYLVNFDALTYAGNLENLKEVENHPNYQFIKGNLLEQEVIEKVFQDYSIDGVIHLAAESHVDRSILGPSAFVQTNIVGTFHLLEVAKKFFQGKPHCRFHHVSTDEVYGSLGATGQFTEHTPYAPNSPYSASKASSDHLVRAYHETYGLNTTISNCSNNYGPYQFPEKLIPLTIQNCLNHREIPVYGDGQNVRDWLYVEDHCEALATIFHHGQSGQTYNVGGHNEWQNIQIVEKICELIDQQTGRQDSAKKLITFVKDRLGHDRRYAIDASKIQKDLGWSPRHSFGQGLMKTVNWYLDQSEETKKQP